MSMDSCNPEPSEAGLFAPQNPGSALSGFCRVRICSLSLSGIPEALALTTAYAGLI